MAPSRPPGVNERMQSNLTCRELVEFLAEYLEGRLSPAELDTFNRHLAACPSCVSYASSYQETQRLGREAFRGPDEPVPPEVPEALVRAILAARDRDA